MSKLELKIPPPLVLITFGVLMWLVSTYLPGIFILGQIRAVVIIALTALGIICVALGATSFRKFKTTVNPIKPETTTVLVTGGIYCITRNPMYLGLLLVLIGWAVFLSNLFNILLLIGFVVYLNKFQIEPEEKVLETLFGKSFLNYKKSVRRWL